MHRSKSRVDAHTYDKSGQLIESFGLCGLVNLLCHALFLSSPLPIFQLKCPLGVCENYKCSCFGEKKVEKQ